MFTEDVDIFLADFGLPCVCNGVSFLGIFDQPDDTLQMSGVNLLSTMYQLTVAVAAVQAAAIATDAALSVNGQAYVVRDVISLTDGAFFRLNLSK